MGDAIMENDPLIEAYDFIHDLAMEFKKHKNMPIFINNTWYEVREACGKNEVYGDIVCLFISNNDSYIANSPVSEDRVWPSVISYCQETGNMLDVRYVKNGEMFIPPEFENMDLKTQRFTWEML